MLTKTLLGENKHYLQFTQVTVSTLTNMIELFTCIPIYCMFCVRHKVFIQ